MFDRWGFGSVDVGLDCFGASNTTELVLRSLGFVVAVRIRLQRCRSLFSVPLTHPPSSQKKRMTHKLSSTYMYMYMQSLVEQRIKWRKLKSSKYIFRLDVKQCKSLYNFGDVCS